MIGNSGNDVLIGDAYYTDCTSKGGDDTLTGGNDNDWIDGNGGNDTAVYFGDRSDYTITAVWSDWDDHDNGEDDDNNCGDDWNDHDHHHSHVVGYKVVDNTADRDGTDMVFNVENFQFRDGNVAVADILNTTGITLSGTPGDDTLNGTSFADVLSGLDGNDTINGGAGNDVIDGGRGNDVLMGGRGDDVYLVSAGSDAIIDNPGEGNDTLDCSNQLSHSVSVNLNSGTYQGRDFSSVLASTIQGVENVIGSARDDRIEGDGADNVLTGAGGGDNLIGGAGADTFVFNIDSSGTLGDGVDVIEDFSAAQNDTLRFVGVDSPIVETDFANNVMVAEVGSDVVISFNAGDSITLLGAATGSINNYATLAAAYHVELA